MKRRYRSRAKWNTVSTFRWSTVATDVCASFKQTDGQVNNRRRNCFYFAMMICSCKQYVSPSNKLMDRSKTQGEIVSTLRWWSIAGNRCQSFKQIDGQINNLRRHCFYFAMMISCCWWISVLQRNWWTGLEQKEKVFVLCDDDLLLLMDLHPSRTFMDRSRTGGAINSTLGWWSLSVIRWHYEYAVQHCLQCSNHQIMALGSRTQALLFSISLILFATSN